MCNLCFQDVSSNDESWTGNYILTQPRLLQKNMTQKKTHLKKPKKTPKNPSLLFVWKIY